MRTAEVCSGLLSGFCHEKLKERGRLEKKTEPRCKANIKRSVKKVMDGHGMD